MSRKKVEDASSGIRIEYVPLEDVKKWDRNPRQHDDAAIERSLKRYGFINPPILDEKTGKLVAGHGRIGALESLRDAGEKPPERIQIGAGGRWLVPVVRGISFSNASEAESYLIADNRLSELGGWDMDSLREILTDLTDDGTDLDAIGWSESAIDRLLEDVAPKASKNKQQNNGSSLDDLTNVNANTRLVPIYLDAASYQPTVTRMRAIMDARRLPDYTALLLFLLDHHDASQPARTVDSDPFAAPLDS